MITVVTRSASYRDHLERVWPTGVEREVREPAGDCAVRCETYGQVVLVHGDSLEPTAVERLLDRLMERRGIRVGYAADTPDLDQMLSLSRFEIAAYFNSYMADVHYRQMLDALATGQCWFVPGLIVDALHLARGEAKPSSLALPEGAWAAELTVREREIALDVAAALSNAEIAIGRGITERTVKSHLTRIYKKLGVRGRLALAAAMRGGFGRAG